MRIISLIRYELIELRRKPIVIIVGILFLFALQQVLWAGKIDNSFNLGLVTFLKNYWLPINLIYIPLLIIFSDIGASDTEVFKIINIKPVNRFASKVCASLIITGLILFVTLITLILVGWICNVPFKYFLYQSSLALINCSLSLFTIMGLGLLIGKFIKIDIIKYILILFLFMGINNFYKNTNVLAPLYHIDMVQSTFELISTGSVFKSHIIIYTLIIILSLILLYIGEEEGKKGLISVKSIICTVVVIGIISLIIVNTKKFEPVEYSVETDNIDILYDENKENNDGFNILEYDMKININKEFKNDCNIKIEVVNDNLSTIKLKLFNKLEVIELSLNNKDISFERDGDNIIINRDTYDRTLNINIKYKGIINTFGEREGKKYFSNSSSIFLADYFEWYPKGEYRGYDKKYSLNIIKSGNKKIYSNLNSTSAGKYEGRDKEIFLVMGNIEEKKYDNHTYVGNIELIDSREKIEVVNSIFNEDEISMLNEKTNIIFTPRSDKQYLVRNIYKDYVLIGELDFQNKIYRN